MREDWRLRDLLHALWLRWQYSSSMSPVAVMRDGRLVNLDKTRAHSIEGYVSDRDVVVEANEIRTIFCGRIAFGYV